MWETHIPSKSKVETNLAENEKRYGVERRLLNEVKLMGNGGLLGRFTGSLCRKWDITIWHHKAGNGRGRPPEGLREPVTEGCLQPARPGSTVSS